MKSIITLMLLVSAAMTAQIKVVERPDVIEVGKITPGGIKTIFCEKSGDTYNFYYKDAKFTQLDEWKSFAIKDVDNAFKNLYDIIKKGFDDMPKEDIMLESPTGYLWLKYEKFLGSKLVRLAHAEKRTEIIGFSNQYTSKQIDKLFGITK